MNESITFPTYESRLKIVVLDSDDTEKRHVLIRSEYFFPLQCICEVAIYVCDGKKTEQDVTGMMATCRK